MRGTIDLVLTLGADDLLKMKSWVDVSYGIHADCKSHTGGATSWGWGVLGTKCQKQKLNTKSSTEGEIVGVSDFMLNPHGLGTYVHGGARIYSKRKCIISRQSEYDEDNNEWKMFKWAENKAHGQLLFLD